jgi:hypothetical protein
MPSFNIGQVGGLLRNLGGQASDRLRDLAYKNNLQTRRNLGPKLRIEYGWSPLSPARTMLDDLRSLPTELSRSPGINAIRKGLDQIPTAINPLKSGSPTTLLGKTGQFFNPLSRANFAGYLADPVINTFVPESMRDTARVAAYTPGGLPVKLLSAGLYDTFLNSRNAGVGLATGTLRDNDPMRYGGLQALESIKEQNAQRPIGTLSQLGGNEVEWRGPDLGWQRTYSEGANPPPPAPGLLQDLSSGRQAGQVGSSVISNGAGVPAQRSDVINRALSQEVLNAAQQFNAPTNIPLPSFYEGQQQLGRSMMQNGTLVSQLQELGGAPGMTPENLKTWAEKNPALAYRELLKRRGVQ